MNRDAKFKYSFNYPSMSNISMGSRAQNNIHNICIFIDLPINRHLHVLLNLLIIQVFCSFPGGLSITKIFAFIPPMECNVCELVQSMISHLFSPAATCNIELRGCCPPWRTICCLFLASGSLSLLAPSEFSDLGGGSINIGSDQRPILAFS